MRKAALVIVLALMATAPAAAQGTAPPPGAAPDGSPPPAAARTRGGAMVAPPAVCDQGSVQDIRKCKAKNLAALQRAIGRKVAESCQKRLANIRGPSAADERLACRYDMLTQVLQGIN